MEQLKQVEFGEGNGPPLLVMHGLFGSARNWGGVAKALAKNRRVIVVDMRNHGQSFHSPDHSYAAMADDLAHVIETQGDRADVLGHSMGGKAAMVLALTMPELVVRLIVADIAPVAYSHTQAPLVQAMRALDLAQVSRRSEADRALANAVPDTATRLFLLQSLVFEKGEGRWLLNLDALGQQMPDIIGFPDVEGAFSGETLFLTGGNSDYVLPEHREKVLAHFPNAQHDAIAGAGHWLHAEKPDEFVAAVERFLG